uniref:SFRICE_034501 n=1 Tax=Spodoptera frugiperda TaxID=7108 RepID=A0A2H1X2M6_SPOFR
MRFENIEEFDDDELHSLRIPLGDYLVEIISGKSDEHRTSKFNVSRRTLERILQIARKCLTVDFMPLYLGLVHLTRDDVIARNLSIPSHILMSSQFQKLSEAFSGGFY